MNDNRWRPGDKPRSDDQYTFLEGMQRMGQGKLGQEIADAVEKATWTSQPTPDPYKMRMWEGRSGRFRFVVTDFEVESQSFEGYRGADGMVTSGTTMARLGHQLAAHAVELAVAQSAGA